MDSALLLVDIQNDYFPGGKMELEGSVEASLRAGRLLTLARDKALPVVHVRHLSIRPGATFFLPETEGAEIHANVRPLASEVVVQKNFPNSFRETSLLEHLKERNIRHVILTGMMTHMCIDATTRAAFDHGFRCTVAHDACATRSLSFQGEIVPASHVQMAFLAALNGVYANVAGVEEIMKDMG